MFEMQGTCKEKTEFKAIHLLKCRVIEVSVFSFQPHKCVYAWMTCRVIIEPHLYKNIGSKKGRKSYPLRVNHKTKHIERMKEYSLKKKDFKKD